MRNSDIQRRSIFLLKQLGVAALYVLFAKISLTFFSNNGVISTVWPSSGLALAVLLIGGKRYFWSVFLGAFLVNALTGITLMMAVAIATGNTLEALIGVWLLTRKGRFDTALQSSRSYLLLILAGSVGSINGALNGATTLLISGFLTSGTYFINLAHWWMGDTLGVILITPLILVCWQTKNDWHGAKRLAEAISLLGLTFVVGQIIFLGWFHDSVGYVAKGYWLFLLIAWIAVRLGARGTVIALNMMAAQALLGAYHRTGFFADDIAQTQLANYWLYMVTQSIIGMALATHFAERKLTEKVLRTSEASLRAILNNSPYLAWLKDTEGRYIHINETYVNYVRLKDVRQAIGKTDFDLWPKELAEKYRLDDAEVIALRQQRHVEEPSFDGSKIHWVETFKTPVIDGKGNVLGTTGFSHDITERKQAEEALRISEERLSLALKASGQGIYDLDLITGEAIVSPEYALMLGYDPAEFHETYAKWIERLHPDDNESIATIFAAYVKGDIPEYKVEFRQKTKGEDWKWVLSIGKIMERDADGNPLRMIGTHTDITERKQAEDALRKLSLAVEQSPSSIVITDLDANIEYVNHAFIRETGYSFAEAIGQNPRLLNSGKNPKATYREMWACLARGGMWKGELINRRKDGSEYIESALISPVQQADGHVTHYLAVKENITERKNNEAQIERLSRAYRLLSRVNEAIVRTQNRNELFVEICNAAIASELFMFVWIGMLDETWVIPVTHAGVEEGYTDKLNILLDNERTGNGPTGRAIRESKYVVCQDIENDPSMAPWRDEALRRGYRASAAFPIREVYGEAGAITVYTAETHFFTPDIIQLMLELAADVSFALDAHTEKQRRERAENEIRQLNVELERRVFERTRQLEAINKELEAFSLFSSVGVTRFASN